MDRRNFLAFIFLFCIAFSCSENDGSTIKQLPFDEFWLSTKFGDTPPNGVPLYFNTWAVLRPHTTVDEYYHYYTSDDFKGFVPEGCNRSFDYLPDNLVHAKVSCKLRLQGNIKPNNLKWLSEINYTIEIKADTKTLEILSAKITFPEYEQEIDLTDSNLKILYHSVNGYLELYLGGDVAVKSVGKEIYLRCVFSKVGG